MSKPDWLTQEEDRAEKLVESGKTANETAPRFVRVMRAPTRKQKAFYIQEQHADAFDLLALEMKKKGIKAPELAEHAIELLLKEYGKEI